MATELGSAYIQIVPSAEGISGSLSNILSGEAASAGTQAGNSFSSSMGGALKTGAIAVGAGAVAIGAAAAAATGAVVSGAKDVASYGDTVDKMSQKLGLSAQAYQEWDYVMNLAGTSMSSMSGGIKTLTNQVDAARNGSADAQEAFSKLGISMDDLNTMSNEEVFEAAIAGFQGMEESTERAALANDIFGRSGQQLAPLFNETTEAVADQIATAENYGMVMNDDLVAASAAFIDSQTTLQGTMQGMKNTMLGELLPSMTSFNEGLSLLFSGDTEAGIELINEGIAGFGDTLAGLLPTVLEVGGNIIITLAESLIENLPQLFETGTEMILQLIQAIIDNLPLLMDAAVQILLSLVNGIAENLPTLIPAAVDAVLTIVQGLIENIPLLIEAALSLIQGLVTGIINALPEIIAAVPEIINAITNTLSQNMSLVVQAGVELLTALVENLPTIIQNIIEVLPDIIDAIINMLITLTPQLVEAGVELFLALIQNLPQIIAGIVGAIPEIITGLVDGFIDNLPQMISTGVELIGGIASGLGEAAWTIISAAGDIASDIWDTITDTDWLSVGWNIIQGIISGIWSAAQSLYNTIASIARSSVNTAVNVYDIGSPSKVFANQVGQWIPKGIALGIDQNADSVTDAMDNIAKDSLSTMQAGVDFSVTGRYGVPALARGRAGESNITINVYPSAGMDERRLADMVSRQLALEQRQRQAAWGNA